MQAWPIGKIIPHLPARPGPLEKSLLICRPSPARADSQDEDKIYKTLNVKFVKEDRVFHSGAALGTIDNERPVNLDRRCEPGIVFHHPETDISQQQSTQPFPHIINWTRTLHRRKISPHSDIYYYPEGFNKKLKSNRKIKEFCTKNNIFFDPNLFDFSTLNQYQGFMPIPDSVELSDKNGNGNVNPSNANIENRNDIIQISSNHNTEL